MRAISISIVTLLALGLCAWLWFGLRDVSDSNAASIAPPAGDVEGELQPEVSDAESTPAAAVREEAANATDEVESGLADSPFPPSPEEGLEVLVLDGEAGTPVSGAVVSVNLAWGGEPASSAWSAMEEDGALAPWRFTGTDGKLLVPSVRDELVISASADGAWGRCEWEPGGPEPAEVVLRPDYTLRVRVVDRGGEPQCGVPVGLRVRGEWELDVETAVTRAPDGIAELLHLQEDWRFEPEWYHWAALSIPLPTPVEVPIELDDLSGEPIELVLPDTAALELELLGPDSRPFELETWVQVWAIDPDAEDGVTLLPCAGERRRVPPGKPVVFGHISPGLRLAIEARSRSGFEAPTLRIPGPMVAGETLRRSIQLEAIDLVFTGRLVDSGGEPLASISFKVAASSEGRSMSRRSESQEDGEFLVSLDPGFLEDAPVVTFSGSPDGQTPTLAQVPVPEDLTPRIVELGDVVMRAPPILATGVVVDRESRPIAGALVQAALNRGLEEERWAPDRIDGVEAIADGEGRFTLLGEVETSTVTLLPSHGSYADATRYPRELEVSVGSRGVTLMLPAPGTIVGNLLVDEGVPPGALDVYPLHPASPYGHSSNDPRPADDGTFRFPGLDPGTYSFFVYLPGGSMDGQAPLLLAENVLVQSGEVTRDPRLQDIDLRGKVFCFEMRATDPDGRPIDDFRAEFRKVGDPSGVVDHAYAWNKSLRILTRYEAVDVVIRADGYRPAEVLGLDSDRSAVLQPGLPVLLTLSDPELIIEAGIELEAAVKQPGVRRGTVYGAFGERGEARVTLSGPGTYHLGLTVSAPRVKGGSRLQAVRGVTPSTIEVVETDDVQVFVVELTAELLEEALEKLRSR